MENFDLTTPVSYPSLTFYRVTRLELDWANASIAIDLLGDDGKRFSTGYSGATALSLMTALNKIDLSVKSLHRRILERLIADGKLPAGSITGNPD